MLTKLKFTSYLLISIILTFGLSLSLQSVLADWTAPLSAPPDDSIKPPVYNSKPQANNGVLIATSTIIGGTFGVSDNLIVNGKVGIGTADPAYKLDVNGTSIFKDKITRMGTVSGQIGIDLDFPSTGNGPAIRFLENGTVRAAIRSYSDKLQIGTGWFAPKITLDSAGNVGIGTADPQARLDVRGSYLSYNTGGVYHYKNLVSDTKDGSKTGTLKITMPKTWSSTMMTITIKGYNYSTNGAWEVVIGGYNYNGTTPYWTNMSAEIRGKAPFNTVRLAHDGTANVVLLGTTATIWNYPKVEVTDFVAGHNGTTGWGSGWSISYITSETGINYIKEPIPPMLISSVGNIGIGKAPTANKLDVYGNVAATAFLYSSDRTLKDNIKPIDNALEKVLALDGVSFNWKEDGSASLGVIAQDLETVFPELVKTDTQTGLKSVEYGNLVAPLIEAIKEQQTEIKELQNNIEILNKKCDF